MTPVVQNTHVQDSDLADQWDVSADRSYSTNPKQQTWNNLSHIHKPNSVSQSLKAGSGFEEVEPTLLQHWPQPLTYQYDAFGMTNYRAVDPATGKTSEYCSPEAQHYGPQTCVPEWETSLSGSGFTFEFGSAPDVLNSTKFAENSGFSSQDFVQVSSAHSSESNGFSLKDSISQEPSMLWPLNVTTGESFTSHRGLVTQTETMGHNVATPIQQVQSASPHFTEYSPMSDTAREVTLRSTLPASSVGSKIYQNRPFTMPAVSNERRLNSNAIPRASARPTSLQLRQMRSDPVVEAVNSRESPPSSKRKSLSTVSHNNSESPEREGKKTDAIGWRYPSRPRSSFQIVQEDGKGGSVSGSAQVFPIARARRQGPLSADGRRDAALRRKDKSVCIWCRLSKKKCSGENPCSACIEQAKSVIIEQPCVRADFFQIVESGTCNYISQRAVNHLTVDGSSRRRMELPSSFRMEHFLSLLEERQGRFNIRVRQAWGTLFVVDLTETFLYLKASQGRRNALIDLRDFIDNHVLRLSDWHKCVKKCDPSTDTLSLLSRWNNMPSRASYDFVLESDEPIDRPMNIEDPNDQIEILIAAQLSRIFCRKLEVDGYRALQNALNKNKWDDMPYETFLQFVSSLGQLLVSLRWRVSWWELLGDGGQRPDINKQRYEERVRSLCKVLYFYYMSVKLKLPSWMSPGELDGIWSTYADSDRVWDDFPVMATAEGFEMWLARGRGLIREAGVRIQIPSI